MPQELQRAILTGASNRVSSSAVYVKAGEMKMAGETSGAAGKARLSGCGNRAQIIEKRGVGDARRAGVLDGGVALGAKSGDGKSHRDAMIGEGIEFGAMETLTAGDAQAIRAFEYMQLSCSHLDSRDYLFLL